MATSCTLARQEGSDGFGCIALRLRDLCAPTRCSLCQIDPALDRDAGVEVGLRHRRAVVSPCLTIPRTQQYRATDRLGEREGDTRGKVRIAERVLSVDNGTGGLI